MKAMILRPNGLEGITLVDMPDPGEPAAGEIRVRIHASSLNYHDLYLATGKRIAADGRIPMSDGAGVVEAIGEGVTEFKPGDSVVSCFFPDWLDGEPTVAGFARTPGDGIDGYACEVVNKPASWFTMAPSGFSHGESATLTTAGLTAWRALVANGGLKAGDVVVALGTGGVSIFALQIAKAMGATVIITSSSDEKLERAKALGADHVVNYKTTEQWAKTVIDLTDGRGADHIVEVGGAHTLAQSFAACRVGGHIALIGLLAGVGAEVPTTVLMTRQQRLQGLVVGSRKQQIDFVRALDVMAFRPVIDKSFPLEGLADAFRHQIAAKHFGKIGITL